jgi:antitoxin component YwqK of YwqJK toxin-antitoxin module
VNDKPHGEYNRWYENGQPCEHTFYVNDELHGEYNFWYRNGQPKEHAFYVNGVEVDIKLYGW